MRSENAALDASLSVASPTRSYVTRVRIAAALAFIGAVLILLGWAFDIALFKSGFPGQRATQPLSAVCFALCALSLGLSTERCILCRLVARGGAIVVLGVAIATVWQNALDVDWGLDQFLFSDSVVHEQTGPYLRAGRPAAGTLVALGLLCGCLLLIRGRSQAARSLFLWMSTTGALLAATLLLAYLYDLQALYAMGFYAHVGLNSAISLGLLSYGVLLRRPDLGWMRLLAGDSAGAASARQILMWTASSLLVLAAIVRLGRSVALQGAGLEVLLLTAGGFGLLLVALVAHARRLNALETLRHSVTSDLRSAESQLVRAAHEKEKQLAVLAHELRNPLTPLRNGVELLRQMSAANPALARTVDMMGRQVVHLVRLVNQLMGPEIPSVEATLTAPALTPAAAAASSGARLLKILVVDDNADAADSLSLLLQARGHEVRTAVDGRRAVELAEGFRPQVILMDVAMPELDGLEATRVIRLRPWGAGVHIIALTAWGQESERRRTREAGMDGHLVKPVDPEALAGVLGSVRSRSS